MRPRGAWRIRTAVRGFAGLCLTTRPRRPAGGMVSARRGNLRPCPLATRIRPRRRSSRAADRSPRSARRCRAAAAARSTRTRPRPSSARARARGGDARRRAARRPGGPRRPPFVGPAGAAARRGARGGRDRPLARLRHERGQALQVEGARQAAHPRQADLVGATACRPWLEAELAAVRPRVLVAARRDRGAVAPRQGLPGDEAARASRSTRRSPSTSSPRSTPRRSSASGTRRRAASSWRRSWTTSE